MFRNKKMLVKNFPKINRLNIKYIQPFTTLDKKLQNINTNNQEFNQDKLKSRIQFITLAPFYIGTLFLGIKVLDIVSFNSILTINLLKFNLNALALSQVYNTAINFKELNNSEIIDPNDDLKTEKILTNKINRLISPPIIILINTHFLLPLNIINANMILLSLPIALFSNYIDYSNKANEKNTKLIFWINNIFITFAILISFYGIKKDNIQETANLASEMSLTIEDVQNKDIEIIEAENDDLYSQLNFEQLTRLEDIYNSNIYEK